eukprot:g32954.t1
MRNCSQSAHYAEKRKENVVRGQDMRKKTVFLVLCGTASFNLQNNPPTGDLTGVRTANLALQAEFSGHAKTLHLGHLEIKIEIPSWNNLIPAVGVTAFIMYCMIIRILDDAFPNNWTVGVIKKALAVVSVAGFFFVLDLFGGSHSHPAGVGASGSSDAIHHHQSLWPSAGFGPLDSHCGSALSS